MSSFSSTEPQVTLNLKGEEKKIYSSQSIKLFTAESCETLKAMNEMVQGPCAHVVLP
jgi:hypothetical protein